MTTYQVTFTCTIKELISISGIDEWKYFFFLIFSKVNATGNYHIGAVGPALTKVKLLLPRAAAAQQPISATP